MDDDIYEIARAIDYVLGEGQLDFGTGICYKNDVFEMHGFWSHEGCDCGWVEAGDETCGMGHPEALFHHFATGFKYTWYKRIGRSSESIGTKLKSLDYYKMVVECLESIRDDLKPKWGCDLVR